MKIYEAPIAQIVALELADVITTSATDEPDELILWGTGVRDTPVDTMNTRSLV